MNSNRTARHSNLSLRTAENLSHPRVCHGQCACLSGFVPSAMMEGCTAGKGTLRARHMRCRSCDCQRGPWPTGYAADRRLQGRRASTMPPPATGHTSCHFALRGSYAAACAMSHKRAAATRPQRAARVGSRSREGSLTQQEPPGAPGGGSATRDRHGIRTRIIGARAKRSPLAVRTDSEPRRSASAAKTPSRMDMQGGQDRS
jgi:hypothetical protein